MRRALTTFVLSCFASFGIHASVITNDNTALVFFASSYDTQPYHYYGDYIGSWVALNHPQFTNHWASASRSGGSLQEANQNRIEREGLAQWENNGQRAIGLIMADDDGGYASNDVRIHLTNTFAAPASLFNGAAYTNEGGWASTQHVTWVGIGAIPHDSADGDSGEIERNNAVTNMCAQVGLQGIDMWHPLWNNGWNTDVTNSRILGFYGGSHPYASGSLAMGIVIAQALAGVDTNVSLATVDWNAAAVVSTNHCVITGINRAGTVLTFTRHDDRLPMAWDVPDGTITNDCRNAFRGMPVLSNAFLFSIAVTNLPAGNYNVSIDGKQIVTLSSSALATGWNMFSSDFSSQYWKQRVAVLGLIRIKNGADLVTLLDHGAGDHPNGFDLVTYQSYSQFFWDSGFRGDALAAQLTFITTNLNLFDKQIHDAAQPTNHIFTISAVNQTITFPSPGDQTYGVSPLTLNATVSSGLTPVYSITSGPATVSSNILTITGAGSVTIEADQPGNANWPPATPVSQTILVAQKALSPSITANNKVYDGTSVATVASRTLTGTVGTDVVALTGGTATFPDKNVGTARTVTANGLTLSGPDAGKYVLSSTTATATANISPFGLTVTGVTAADRVYDGTITATVFTNNAVLVGIIGADAVTLGGTAVGTFADSNVGVGKIVTISGLTLGGGDAGNYQLSPPSATASIIKATTLLTATSSLNPAPAGSNVLFTSVLSVLPPGGGVPTGTIIFRDGGTALMTNAVNGAPATFDISTLAQGVHAITVEYSGDSNFFGSSTNLTETIQASLVAGPVTLQRYPTGGAKIRSSALLTNATDAAGDTISLLSVNASSAAGGTVAVSGGWVYYIPPASFTNCDTFSYVISDSANLQATGLVTVKIVLDTNPSQNIAPSEGDIHQNSPVLQFSGIPQRTYTIQYSTNLVNWLPLGTTTADSSGLIIFTDNPPVGSASRSYRTTYP